MKTLMRVLIASVAALSNQLLANVTITESNGVVSLSTSNLSFGKAPRVVLHEDFDTGTAGSLLSNFSLSASGGEAFFPRYSSDFAVTGKLSGMSNFLGQNYNSSAEFKNLGSLDIIYLSYYFKADKLSGDASRNVKLARLSGGHNNNTYNQSVGTTFFDVYSNGIFVQASKDNAESKVPTQWILDYIDNKWHRSEYFIKLSTPAGAANGITIGKMDGKQYAKLENVVNEETGMRYEWLSLPYYVAHDAGGDYKIYYDNVVVSTSRARVELCAKSPYSECTQPVIAKFESWSDNVITIKKENLSDALPYVYIFDENDTLISKQAMTSSRTYSNNTLFKQEIPANGGILLCDKCPSHPL